jgi:hypothetical protein
MLVRKADAYLSGAHRVGSLPYGKHKTGLEWPARPKHSSIFSLLFYFEEEKIFLTLTPESHY